MSNDFFDNLPNENENSADIVAGEGDTLTPIAVDVANIEKSILSVSITDMTITTADERAEANDIMGSFKKCEKQIKAFEAAHIAPKKAEIAVIVSDIKPMKNKIAGLIKIVKTATVAWDLEIARAARVEQEKERKRIEAERKKAEKIMLENKRKGEKTDKVVLEKVVAPAPVIGSVKVETDRGTSSGKLGKVWFIIKTDGTEWDKNTRLPLMDVAGYEGDERYGSVDTVLINEGFKTKGITLPKWIQTREEIINSRFTE